MQRIWPLLLALAVVVVGPIAMYRGGVLDGQDKVVVITPHNEAIRVEFGRGFREWYRAKTGRTVTVDFRTPGGTTEITRYLVGEYTSAFQLEWKKAGRSWTNEVASAFMNEKIQPEAHEARRAFLASGAGVGIDLFFGGGSFDFQGVAGQGMLVDCGYVAAHPELFGEGKPIPPFVGGEAYYDKAGRWIGTTVGAFGIAYNRDSLARLGLPEPRRWSDLADARYFRAVALANPMQSSSATKAFEMLIQQQMNEGGRQEAEGWAVAMRLIQRIAANARYFTDSSAKISLDVEAGEAAAGMTIDFYGRFQSEAVRRPDGSSRIGYANAEGGTSFGVDPIGLLRGARNREVALRFIDYVMGDGQKLWGWKAGASGGPAEHALRRLPILPSLYAEEFRALRSDPDVLPYEAAKGFTYVEARSGKLFRVIAFIVRVMCIDTHDELKAAWRALNDAKARTGSYPPEALAAFEDVAAVSYAAAKTTIRDATSNADKLKAVELAKTLGAIFRANYERAAALARAGK